MRYQELIILLPCHSLEDFPAHHTGEPADNLLACWTALWHPALIAGAESAPVWKRVDQPPAELAGRLLLMPRVCRDELPTGMAARVSKEEGTLLRPTGGLAETTKTILELSEGGDQGISSDLASDFHALGYTYLQIELLTRQMRYSSNLDLIHFDQQVVQAAQAAASGEEQEARDKLAACFDTLAEERDHYYPVDVYMLDFTLVANTTLGKSLADTIDHSTANKRPTNLLLSGDVLSDLATQNPATLSAISQAWQQEEISVIGGELTPRRWPLLSTEAMIPQFIEALTLYEQHLGKKPTIYARRQSGLSPMLPTVLERLGYEGAIHATLDDGAFPESSQMKTRWETLGGSGIDAIAKPPLDARESQTYLNLAESLGHSMDMDHVATVCLAHWPGDTSPWFDILARTTKYHHALGKWITLEEYFEQTAHTSQLDRFQTDAYRTPHLKQSLASRQTDPISSLVRYWRRRVTAQCEQTLSTLAASLSGVATPGEDLLTQLEQMGDEAPSAASPSENHGGETEPSESNHHPFDEQVSSSIKKLTEQIAEHLPRADSPATPGYLLLNPWSFPRRVRIAADRLKKLPPPGRPIYAVSAGGNKQVTADLPPLGFTWIDGTADRAARAARSKEKTPKIIEEGVLRNEFCEVHIDPTTGALRSIRDYHNRGNRLSQQLAYRSGEPKTAPGETLSEEGAEEVYSVMAADQIKVTTNTNLVGEVTARGRLLDRQGKTLAEYEQTYRLSRGSRVLELDIQLDPVDLPPADPWIAYYCARFAWNNESADLSRNVGYDCQKTQERRLEAPLLIEIDSAETSTCLLTGGLPYHRRIGYRKLDTLLIVSGERQRKFQMGIGIDVPTPMRAALDFLTPPISLAQEASPPATGSSSWLYHLSAKNVVVTECMPLVEEGKVTGLTLYLQEVMGRAAEANLEGFRPFLKACRTDLQGKVRGNYKLQEGVVPIKLPPHGWEVIQARWA